MNPTEYQELAGRTECDQHKSRLRMMGSVKPESLNYVADAGRTSFSQEWLVPIRVNHALIGMSGEVGELCSLLQKWIYYGKQFGTEDETHLERLRVLFAEEVGDVLWYAAELCNALGLDMGAIMEANIAKLKKRYPDKYTDHHAAEENRDTAAEIGAVAANVPRAGELLKEAREEYQKAKNEGFAVAYGGSQPTNPCLDIPPPTLLCRYCPKVSSVFVLWKRGALGGAGPVRVPYCGFCSLKDALARRGMTAPVQEGIDYTIETPPAVVQDGHGFGHVE